MIKRVQGVANAAFSGCRVVGEHGNAEPGSLLEDGGATNLCCSNESERGFGTRVMGTVADVCIKSPLAGMALQRIFCCRREHGERA